MKQKRIFYPLEVILMVLALTGACTLPQSAAGTLPPPGVTTLPIPPGSPALIPASATPIASPTPPPAPTETPTPTATPSPVDRTISFAVIGDYGSGSANEASVAALVESWKPEFIITVGDNNYPNGEAATIDDHIGQFYSDFIFPYAGAYGPGSDINRFFPTLGNHDWNTNQADPHLDYFTLPGNERYYDFTWGPVHFFALDSDSREPDGVSRGSVQAQWLQAGLAASSLPWKVVYMHQPPYSSGLHGPVDWAQWPYADWGASVVLGGHDHTYERLEVDGIPYFVNGLGGGEIYYFDALLPESRVRYAEGYGAMLVVADKTQMTLQFITVDGDIVDTYRLQIGQ